MTSYFEDYTKRFFFVLGETDDEYCTSKLQLVNIEQIIHQHLKKLGYTRIVFALGSRGLYCYDEQSYNQAFNIKKARKDTTSKKPYHHRTRGLLKGKIASNNKNTKKESNNNKLYNAISESSLRNHVTNFMKDNNTKTAIIFPDFHDFLTHTKQDVKRDLGVDIKNLSHLSSENQNIIIFITPSTLEADMLNSLGKQHNWQFLTNAIFIKGSQDDSVKLSSNSLVLSTAQKDEIRNLLNYYRITKNIPMEWKEFDDVIDILTKYIKEQSSESKEILSLKKLNTKLLNISKITKDNILETLNEKTEKEGFEKLKELKGLGYLYDEINKLVNYVKSELEKEENIDNNSINTELERLLPSKQTFKNEINLNVALKGNPGTGKTTVAKIISQIYKENDILEVGHLVETTASDLIAGYVGQTAIKTQEVINRAIGGVLFIDEAYKLSSTNNSFGQESIDTIVEAITARQGEFAVIIAGYPKEIDDFLDTNPGLSRRFPSKITIKDYEPEILIEIFKSQIQKKDYIFSENLERVFPYFVENWFNARDEKNFGNAGDVINLFNDMAKSANYDRRKTLELSDIPTDKKIYAKEQTKESMQDALNQLDNIIGLESVKENIKSIISSIKVSKKRDKNSKVVAGHYIFKGNPGTGKTTVARIFAEVLKDLKVVNKGHFKEIALAKLLGTVVGEAEKNTTKILKESLGGVLFIDEAHNLAKGGENDYGKKVISTITPFIENQRDNIIVILAGYPQEMDRLLDEDAGLKSRFTNIIEFEDYNEFEMLQIFKIFSKDFILGDGIEKKLLEIFKNAKANSKHFGNGREVRNIFNTIRTNLDKRLEEIIDNLSENDERLYKIELQDLNL